MTRMFRIRRHNLLVAVVLAVVGIAGATAAAMFQGQSDRTESKTGEQPTVIQEDQMTERQSQHSRLFKHSGPKFQDLAARQMGDIEVEEGVGLMMVLPQAGPKRPVFQSAVCSADAVLVGSIKSKSSQLTEEQNFVFTDYEVTVEEVIKNNALSPIQVDSTITATRDGGVIELNHRIFRARREDFDAAAIGQRYLLFLRFVPATSAYLMHGNGTFELSDQRVFALGPAARDEITKSGIGDPANFLAQVRNFATRACTVN